MVAEPPGVTPTPKTPDFGEGKPRLGEGEEAQPNKPFSLEPGEPKPAEGVSPTEQPTPMEVAREVAEQQRPELTPEQLGDKASQLKNQFGDVQNKLQNPDITNKFSPDHYEALNRAVEKTNPDLRSIASNSKSEFNPPQHEPGESVLGYVGRWLNGSQETMSGAIDFLSKADTQASPGTYLKLQMAMQKASQRGELFASIVGSSVSGIKTIMSTQLG